MLAIGSLIAAPRLVAKSLALESTLRHPRFMGSMRSGRRAADPFRGPAGRKPDDVSRRGRRACSYSYVPVRDEAPLRAGLVRSDTAMTHDGSVRSRPPPVDEVLRTQTARHAADRFGRTATVNAVRAVLAQAREAGSAAAGPEAVAQGALVWLEAAARPSVRRVFNLTGTVIHTNLGRAMIAEAAVEAAVAAMRHAVALEYDVVAGRRGERDDHLRGLLCELTGAEDATIVNNNAAAVLLALNTLARGREAIVSRGELIEIGGAFRLPDIMARAGARLVEVGTTACCGNRPLQLLTPP